LKQTERQGNTLSAVLRQAWESGNLRTLTKNSPTRATDAHVSIIGHITADEADLSRVQSKFGFLFQGAALFDSMTVVENVALPLRKHRGLSESQARTEALSFLQKVYMESFAEHRPATLSDGMRKRVAIARALTLSPKYLLFDEPTTGLDPVSARRVDKLIRELSTSQGVTSVVVSHDLTSIFSVADRIAFLYQGKVHLEGSPTDFRRSEDPVVRQFVQGSAEGPMETPGF